MGASSVTLEMLTVYKMSDSIPVTFREEGGTQERRMESLSL